MMEAQLPTNSKVLVLWQQGKTESHLAFLHGESPAQIHSLGVAWRNENLTPEQYAALLEGSELHPGLGLFVYVGLLSGQPDLSKVEPFGTGWRWKSGEEKMHTPVRPFVDRTAVWFELADSLVPGVDTRVADYVREQRDK
jgi:hypothetical protein